MEYTSTSQKSARIIFEMVDAFKTLWCKTSMQMMLEECHHMNVLLAEANVPLKKFLK